jgi:hypothetical protein
VPLVSRPVSYVLGQRRSRGLRRRRRRSHNYSRPAHLRRLDFLDGKGGWWVASCANLAQRRRGRSGGFCMEDWGNEISKRRGMCAARSRSACVPHVESGIHGRKLGGARCGAPCAGRRPAMGPSCRVWRRLRDNDGCAPANSRTRERLVRGKRSVSVSDSVARESRTGTRTDITWPRWYHPQIAIPAGRVCVPSMSPLKATEDDPHAASPPEHPLGQRRASS